MKEELQDDQFEKLIADKQHKELMLAIRELIKTVKSDQDSDSKVVAAIERNNQAVQDFVGKIQGMMKQEIKMPEMKSPDVNVNVNQEAVVAAIEKFCKEMTQGFEEIKQAVAKQSSGEWEFVIKRNAVLGTIESVVAKERIYKSKYQA